MCAYMMAFTRCNSKVYKYQWMLNNSVEVNVNSALSVNYLNILIYMLFSGIIVLWATVSQRNPN